MPIRYAVDNFPEALGEAAEAAVSQRITIDNWPEELSALPSLYYAPLYESVLNVLGSTGVIVPMGDTNSEAANRTTVTTRGEEAAVFTYSEAVTAFDTPPTFYGPGRIPVITFNGTDEILSTPDAGYWSNGDGSNDNAFSVGVWTLPGGAGTERVLLSKMGSLTTLREYLFELAADNKLYLFLYDESEASNETHSIASDAAVTIAGPTLLGFSYDGTGGSGAGGGVDLYQDGAGLAHTATGGSGYTAMEDQTALPKIGARNSTSAGFFNGAMYGGPIGLFACKKALSADEWRRLYQLGGAALGLPLV